MSPELLKWIEEQKPALVGAAEGYLKTHAIFLPTKPKKPKIAGSQIRNLLSAAQSGSPLAVIVNLLRYQVGRGPRGWDDRTSGEALETLLREQVEKRSVTRPADERHAAEARLASLLFGYLVREFTYRCRIAGTTP